MDKVTLHMAMLHLETSISKSSSLDSPGMFEVTVSIDSATGPKRLPPKKAPIQPDKKFSDARDSNF